MNKRLPSLKKLEAEQNKTNCDNLRKEKRITEPKNQFQQFRVRNRRQKTSINQT